MHSQIEEAIVIYCIIDDVLKSLKHKDDIRAIFSDAEILLIAIIAMLYYGGNYTKAIKFCMDLLKKKISLSRFIRRLKRLDNLYFSIFNLVIKLIKQKIPLSQVENFIEASKNDVIGLYLLPLNLEGKILYGDRAYNDYFAEDALKEYDNVKLEVIRKKNSKRFDYYKQRLVAYFRKTVETVGNILTTNFPTKIHTITLDGFIRKIHYFVLSFNINCLIKLTYN